MTISIILCVLFCLIATYMFVQNHILQISEYDIVDQKIPHSFSNYTIAHLSDFHSTSSFILKKMLLSALNKRHLDLIIITGDMIDERHIGWQSSLNFIKRIIKIAPVIFVSGNHEVSIEKYEEFIQQLQTIGVIVLRNQCYDLINDQEIVKIYGLEDPAFKKPPTIAFTAKSFLQSLDTENDKYKILLSHRPELIKIYTHKNFNLIFAGHAHGGQFRIPGIGGVFSPGEKLWPKYTEGVHVVKDAKMIISRGIGRSSFPFRINNRPELIFVTLKNDKQ